MVLTMTMMSRKENFVTHYLIVVLVWMGFLMAIWSPDPLKWVLSSVYCYFFGRVFGLMKKKEDYKVIKKDLADLNYMNLRNKK